MIDEFKGKVDESIAINYFKSLPGNWIYIKNINNSCFRQEKEQVTTYTKFRVRNVTIDNNTILIYGIEDRDRVTFDKKFIYSYQMTPMRDEIYIQMLRGQRYFPCTTSNLLYRRTYPSGSRKRTLMRSHLFPQKR